MDGDIDITDDPFIVAGFGIPNQVSASQDHEGILAEQNGMNIISSISACIFVCSPVLFTQIRVP